MQINVNATTVHSNIGDRKLGHLVITISDAKCKLLSDSRIAFKAPTALTDHPVQAY